MSGQYDNQNQDFATLDAAFVRVLEDLIDTLIEKGALRLTDLPVAAQDKLAERKGLRQRLNDALNLLDDDEHIL